MNIAVQLLIVGLMVGTLYGLLGSTLTLMFRSTGILSFAHAGFALIGAYTYAGFSCPHSTGVCGDPTFKRPWISALVCVAITTLVAMVVERLVIRPLQFASIVRKSVATAAVLGLSSGVMLQLYGPQTRAIREENQIFPVGTHTIGGVVVDNQHIGILVVSVLVMGSIAFVLSRSWFGLGIRAAGQRPDVVRLFGVRPATTSRFNWALGGALSGLAGVLIAPINVVNVGTFSFLLVKAVAASLLGGMVSLPLTFLGGLALGAIEALTPNYFSQTGSSTLGITVVVMIGLILNRKQLARFGSVGDSGATRSGLPSRSQLVVATAIGSWAQVVHRVPRVLWIVPAVLLVRLPLTDAYYGAIGLNVVFYALLAMSLMLPAGDAGQPTFLQIGFAGVGAFMFTTAQADGWSFFPSALFAIVSAIVVGAVVGRLTLRFRGAAFAILSLAFGALISDYLLRLPFIKTAAPAPTFLGMDLLDSRRAFAVALVLFVIFAALVLNFRRSALGASFRTLRSGPRVLATFGVNANVLEVKVFAFSAGIAGAGGVVYALLTPGFSTFQFIPLVGVIIMLAGFVGGLQSLRGPIIAGLIFGYGPTVVSNLSTSSANAFPQIASSGLALVLVVTAPGGLASIGTWAQEVLAAKGSGAPSKFRGQEVLPKAFGEFQPRLEGTSPRRLGPVRTPVRSRLRRHVVYSGHVGDPLNQLAVQRTVDVANAQGGV